MVDKDKLTNVLLVDDERQEYLLIGYLLSEARHKNYRLIWCQDIRKGLESIEKQKCDVVLLDYHCGDSDNDFLRQARALNSSVPIVVMTDDMEHEVDSKAIQQGASDYLIKDRLNAEVLERTIRYSIERKQIEHRLDHLAHYDHLTDLPNRTLFLDRLRQAINLSQRSNTQFTLMFIDLNDFKEVNDNYGHEIGDRLLQEFAKRLTSCVRRSDTIARIGGDEFTVLLNNVGSTPKIMSVAQKLIEQTQELFIFDDIEFTVGCSIGIAVFPDSGIDAESLQRHADMAMYQAKREAASSYRFYTEKQTNHLKLERLTPLDLKQLIIDNKMVISYTPRIELESNRIIAVDVSPMWYHDRWGMQPYDKFVHSINNSETLRLFTEWMFTKALMHMVKLHNIHQVRFSFAIDCQQLQTPRFCYFAKRVMEKYQIDGDDIEITFLQKKSQQENESIDACVDNVSSIGAHLGVAKFGENTFSLSSIQRYPVTLLHLDRMLLKTAIKNKADSQLVEALILLAHKLNKTVIADGIDTKAHAQILRTMGCDQVKGKVLGNHFSLKALKIFLDDNKTFVKRVKNNN